MSSKQDVALAVGIVALLLAVHRALTLTDTFAMEQLTALLAILILLVLVYLVVRPTAPAL